MPSVETVLLIAASLFVVSILASKASARLGVPSLLLFVGIGMLAGSDGPGGIYFDFPWVTQFVGVTALALILFAAGFDTRLKVVRPVIAPAISLATIGVLISTALVGLFMAWVWQLPPLHGLLVGAIISSTDAAAVISLLRSRNLSLRSGLQEVIEFESGSNDPMAVLLTIVLLHLVTYETASTWQVASLLVRQIVIGLAGGFALGHVGAKIINRIRLESEGLYPVLSVTIALLSYSIPASLSGSGFLSVYVAGLIIGNNNLIHRNSVRVFNDGISWLMQITMFLVLGLQVFPSRLPSVAAPGLLIASFLMFVARPVSVFAALPTRRFSWRERLFISWAGLRGAVPVVLATFPLLAGMREAGTIFNVVFFVALTSLLIQGTTLPLAARFLHVGSTLLTRPSFPIQFNPTEFTDKELVELTIRAGAPADGKRIMDLGLPARTLVVLVGRSNQFVAPEGGTVLRQGDIASVLTTREHLSTVRTILEG
ncbi:MAG: potassium/proton antiporter [Terriglobia bacterium]|nr:potassium/proton antiporter [Terriglobia bacterium]